MGKRSPASNLILLVILFSAFLAIYRSAIYVDEDRKLGSSFPCFGFVREQSKRTSRVNAYASSVEIDWGEVLCIVGEIKDNDGFEPIGHWENVILDVEPVWLQLEHVPEDVTWET